jgi:hypothetical protein
MSTLFPLLSLIERHGDLLQCRVRLGGLLQ